MFTNFAMYLSMISRHILLGDTFPACALKCFVITVIQVLKLVNLGILGHYARRDVPILCIGPTSS